MRTELVLGAALVLLLSPAQACFADHSTSAVHNGLLHYLETDAAMYWMHGPVQIHYSVTNVTPDSLPLTFGCRNDQILEALSVRVKPPYGPFAFSDPPGCYFWDWYDVLAPDAAHVKETTWDMQDMVYGGYVSEPGIYTIWATTFIQDHAYDYTIQLEIELLDPSTGALAHDVDTWTVIKALYR